MLDVSSVGNTTTVHMASSRYTPTPP
jgi:hypothetical protein